MRHYQPIWEKLKTGKSVRVTVPKPLHKRVIKAVMKEKYNDLGYKVLLSEKFKHARLSVVTEQSVITFKLIESLGLGDI